VKGLNDVAPEQYAAMIQDSGASFVEIKGYMYLGYSRNRLARENMPEHAEVRAFAEKVATASDYRFKDENELSRVVVLERMT
jgi:tRNA wybutosine-synthesizing protein 1